jgi:hypothetical protein
VVPASQKVTASLTVNLSAGAKMRPSGLNIPQGSQKAQTQFAGMMDMPDVLICDPKLGCGLQLE